MLIAASGFAQSPEPAATEPAAAEAPDARELARRHFRNGIKLYQDANYAGAMAEFEAAYRLKPTAGSLQNVALCQKALFRYAEAGETLEQLLLKHGSELDEGEQRAMREAMEELKSLVGSVLLKVSVPEARVTLNGRVLTAQELKNPIRLNVGEHTLSADAPGYAPFRQSLRVASGSHAVPVEIKLRPTAGFLNITTRDPKAYIGVNGYAKGQHRWRGPVEPGKEHLVQVYRDGFEPFEQNVSVDLGQTLDIVADLGPPIDADEPPPEVTPSGVPMPKRPQRGFYGLVTLSALGMSETPLDLDPSQSQKNEKLLGAIGLRGGYRLSAPLAAELMLDLGSLRVSECDGTTTSTDCAERDAVMRDYELGSFHFGPNVRVMSTGERVRFVGTVGAGIVFHRLEVTGKDGFEDHAQGVDPYFMIDAGIGFNLGPWLVEASLLARVDGSSSLQGDFDNPTLGKNLGTTLPMAGLNLRVGWGQWRPR